VETDSADTLADGLAVRKADPVALSFLQEGLSGIVSVSDEEVENAMRDYFQCTHNLAEGAGAAPLAALIQDLQKGGQWDSVGIVLSGSNVSAQLLKRVLE
jgi:threonine dehydratase